METGPCPGVLMTWTPGSIYITYHFVVHAYKSIEWEPIAFNVTTDKIHLQADGCLGLPSAAGHPCSSCSKLHNSTKLVQFMDCVGNSPNHTPWYLLNTTQLKGLTR